MSVKMVTYITGYVTPRIATYHMTQSHMSVKIATYITGHVTPRIARYHMTLSHMSVKIATYITTIYSCLQCHMTL